MKKKWLSLSVLVVGIVLVSCDLNEVSQSQVPDEVLSQITAMGFSTRNVQRVEDGWLVEGDITLRESDLRSTPNGPTLRIAEVEQYRTFNLVSGPRTITVSTSGNNFPAGLSTAVNNAIARYNAENLGLTFVRVANGGDIVIRLVNTRQYIASAGFPSGGDPYGEVKYSKGYSTGYSDGFMTTVIAHEMGHCIGFRHTDYMNRAYSCGSGGNEGQETTGVGAVHIPGTPTGPDSGSWMLACLSATTNRPFNNNDKTALNYLY